MASVEVRLEMKTITCSKEKCGITFAVPDTWETKRREDHTQFFCPNGHPQWFPHQSEAERLSKELARERAAHDQTKADRDDAKIRLETVKAGVAKTRCRIKNGVCPCCTRSFANLQRHMKTKHPEYAKEKK